jgi:hypothetical protein
MEQAPSESRNRLGDKVLRLALLFILSCFSVLIKVMTGTFLIAIALLKKVVREKRKDPKVQTTPSSRL